jgi:MFS-type transporter involved in bile tolerance (Atg22 family)
MSKTKADMKELRKFALTMFCALGILGSILLWRRHDTGFVLWGIGSAALLLAWVQPKVLKPVYKYWMKLALALGFVTSHVVLALLYYLVVTPTGLVMRLLGKNPLVLQLDEKAKSYWIKRETRKYDKQCYEKMF